jgi:hypothetical protein
MGTIDIILLCMTLLSLALAAVAYWRSGGRRHVETLRAEMARHLEAARARERALAEQLSRRIHNGYEDALTRIRRAEQRLAELRENVSDETRQAIDLLRAQLEEARHRIEAGLQQVKEGASSRAEALQESLHRRVLRLEGQALLLLARADIKRAQSLAEKHEFERADDLLQEAVSKVREVRMRLSDPFEDDPAYKNVVITLLDAIRSVRAQAADYEGQIERVLLASDALMASIAAREQTFV